MGFPTAFLFLGVLCIEDTQNLTGICPRKCRCVLARCVHLLPLHPLKMFLLLFIVPVTMFPQLSPYSLSVSGKLFNSLSRFSVCVSNLFQLCLSSLLVMFFSFFHCVSWYSDTGSFCSFSIMSSFFSEVILYFRVLLVFQATLSLVITLPFVKCKICGEKVDILLCLQFFWLLSTKKLRQEFSVYSRVVV